MTRRSKLLLSALAVMVLGLTFGKAIGSGYYFGGCDEVANARHFVVHELGFKMCRDEHIETETATAPSTPAETVTAPSAPTETASPCVLDVRGHNARLEIAGPEAVGDCEGFERAAGSTPWTMEAQGAPAPPPPSSAKSRTTPANTPL